jgi:hypothetical protein
MATTLVEARAQATTLPRRAAVDPTAGAAEWESAKFMVQKKRDVKERERKTTGEESSSSDELRTKKRRGKIQVLKSLADLALHLVGPLFLFSSLCAPSFY